MPSSNKEQYGEVFTPEWLVVQMMDDALELMGDDFFDIINHTFEPGAGRGCFYHTLHKNNKKNEKMKYTMNEINREHEPVLRSLIDDERDKVIIQNMFDITDEELIGGESVDFVWGNLPFHNGGKCFVPGLISGGGGGGGLGSKPNTVWPKMIHFMFDHILKPGGHFYAIIPCIWLKEDRAKIYDLFVRKHQLCFLRVFDCVRANAIFGYDCQTPVCYVMVRKNGGGDGEECEIENENKNGNNNKKRDKIKFKLFDESCDQYIDFTLLHGLCIPTKHASLFQEAILRGVGSGRESLYKRIHKVACMRKSILGSAFASAPGSEGKYKLMFHKKNITSMGRLEDYVTNGEYKYKIITGSSVDKKTGNLILHGFVSRVPGLYSGTPKLILPHKRLLRCFKDYDGTYGFYGRDMHVFLCKQTDTKEEIDALETKLTQPDAHKMIESGFTIRMNFIEKYVFQYIF